MHLQGIGCWCRREDSNLHGAINPTRSLAWHAVARSFRIGFHTFDERLTPITRPPKTLITTGVATPTRPSSSAGEFEDRLRVRSGV